MTEVASKSTTIYKAQPKQILFHNSTADEVFYGGAAGGGKSYAILFDAVIKCLTYDNIRVGIFRRTYPELEKSIIYNFLSKVPSSYYTYSKKEHRATFVKTNSALEFNHCQYEADVYKYQSAEYDFLYFDELTHFSEFMFRYLLSRLRTTNTKIKPQVKSASNPGNVGHLWVKKRYIDDARPYEETERIVADDEGRLEKYSFCFIPATLEDNKILSVADPSYRTRLLLLPEDEKKALLYGDWNVFKGQYFKEWDERKHIVEPFEIPLHWRRFRGLDWGGTSPFCVLWIAVEPNVGRFYVYREYYGTNTNLYEFASNVNRLNYDLNGNYEKIDFTACDPSLYSVNQYERGVSIAYQLTSEYGLPVVKSDNNRIAGWSLIHTLLQREVDGKPLLVFFKNCVNCIRTIPALVHDKNKPEDLDTMGEDHAADALRYALMYNPSITGRPVAGIKKLGDNVDRFFEKLFKKNDDVLYVGR